MDPRRKLGELGEDEAVRHLERLGHEILDRNFRTRYGELDIVARDARFLVFCEVKTRVVRLATRDVLGPFASIGVRKQRQVRAMAREWLAQGRLDGARPPEVRFDAVGVSFDAQGRLQSLEHLEAAF
jgi:putative endonuclease